MLLCVDIGNTNITLGLFKSGKLIKSYDIPTHQKSYGQDLNKLFKGKIIEDCLICSVVPEALAIFKRDIRKITHNTPKITGRDISVPVKNLYRNPAQVGQDRLVNAYAGIKIYSVPLIVIDFGTAVTFDVISAKKEYLGGMILPGLRISLQALSQKTALLPEIKLQAPKEFIGRSTKNSMLSGTVYGFAALTDELVSKIRAVIGKNAVCIGTGGNIDLISKYCKKIDKTDKTLTLKGLYLLYENSS